MSTLLAVSVLSGLHAQDKTLIAGWDFSQSQSVNTTAAQNALNGSWNANYSHQGAQAPSANYDASAVFGSVYWDGQFGSSTTNFNATDQTAQVSGRTNVLGLTSNDSQSISTFNASSSYTQLRATGQTVAVNATLGFIADVAVTFALDAGSAKSDWELLFAAIDSDGATINVDASTTGAFAGEETSFGSLSIGTTDTGYGVDFSSLGSTQELYVRMSAVDVAGGTLNIDNVGFSAVPEPSAYAAIFGAIAIAFAVVRRRRA